MNNIVFKYDLNTDIIQSEYTPSEAKNIADEIKAALEKLIEQLREIISKLFNELSDRDIDIEQEYETDFDISDSFY